MRNQKKLLLEQMDRKLKPFCDVGEVIVPSSGWINSVRLALGITLEQLGRRLNMTKQGVKKVEERESAGSITLNSLQEIGKALHLKLVYGFVPIDGSLENLVDIKAQKLAQKVVLRTHQNMRLENQGNSDHRIDQAIDELASEIKREMRKSLWD
jgi:predicted DNA-binding mobile mystery protein A